MKRPDALLDEDLSSPAITSYRVAVIDLDGGPLYLTDGRHLRIGGRELLPAVQSWGTLERGQATLTLRAEGLPAGPVWWINRRCRVYRITPGQPLVERGLLLLDGVIEQQPAAQRGALTLKVSRPLYLKPRTVPGLGIIDADSYPKASDQAMGKAKPLVYGTVERCPLLLVDGGFMTTLQAIARPGDVELTVADASAFPESGQVRVDGVTYTYAGRDDTRFLGVSVTALHAAGTVVHQPKGWTYLAAGHAVEAISAVQADNTALTGYSVDLAAASITFPSPPVRQQTGALETWYAQFDRVNAASTALDAVNAIRAATGNAEVQTAVGLPVVVKNGATQAVGLTFPRPASQGGSSTIIAAAYEVAFTVVANVDCDVQIGGKTVYVQRATAVIYNASPVTWLSEENTDQVGITIGVAEGVAANLVTVTVAAARRTVVVGNDDNAAPALLRAPSNRLLSVQQTTAMADRGKIRRAVLGIEWFANDALLPSERLDVRCAGVSLGTLRRVADGAQTASLALSFDLAAAGRARMQARDITSAISGGVTTLANVATLQRMTYPVMYGGAVPGATVQRGSAWLTPPVNVKTDVVHTVTLRGHVDGDPATVVTLYDYDGASGIRARDVSVTRGGLVQSGIYLTAANDKPRLLYDLSANYNLLYVTVEVEWQITPIQSNNTPASGTVAPSAAVISDGLPLSGVVADSTSLQVPGDRRTVVNTFDLPLGTRWDWFTGKDLEIELISPRPGLTVAVLHAQLMIEHEPVAHVPAEPDGLTATVTGHSGNPADIARALAEAAGDRIAAGPYRRARDWYARQGWTFARVIDSDTAARDLMYAVCDEALLGYHETDAGLALIRHLDLGTPITDITDRDLMAPAQISWTALTDLATDITLRYRRIDRDTTRVLVRNAATPDRWAQRGEAAVRTRLPSEIDSDWIADDATALAVLKGRMRLSAPLRRTVALSLRPAFARLEAGDLIRWDGGIYRVTQPRSEGARITLTATEIPV